MACREIAHRDLPLLVNVQFEHSTSEVTSAVPKLVKDDVCEIALTKNTLNAF